MATLGISEPLSGTKYSMPPKGLGAVTQQLQQHHEALNSLQDVSKDHQVLLQRINEDQKAVQKRVDALEALPKYNELQNQHLFLKAYHHSLTRNYNRLYDEYKSLRRDHDVLRVEHRDLREGFDALVPAGAAFRPDFALHHAVEEVRQRLKALEEGAHPYPVDEVARTDFRCAASRSRAGGEHEDYGESPGESVEEDGGEEEEGKGSGGKRNGEGQCGGEEDDEEEDRQNNSGDGDDDDRKRDDGSSSRSKSNSGSRSKPGHPGSLTKEDESSSPPAATERLTEREHSAQQQSRPTPGSGPKSAAIEQEQAQDGCDHQDTQLLLDFGNRPSPAQDFSTFLSDPPLTFQHPQTCGSPVNNAPQPQPGALQAQPRTRTPATSDRDQDATDCNSSDDDGGVREPVVPRRRQSPTRPPRRANRRRTTKANAKVVRSTQLPLRAPQKPKVETSPSHRQARGGSAESDDSVVRVNNPADAEASTPEPEGKKGKRKTSPAARKTEHEGEKRGEKKARK
ncbi:hypothetical protein H2203_005862 [Taxawa tesnikishii (nom. ined.)]|nr:hypothetical protein H2203_005862 [Dothideales sp. JES 119]